MVGLVCVAMAVVLAVVMLVAEFMDGTLPPRVQMWCRRVLVGILIAVFTSMLYTVIRAAAKSYCEYGFFGSKTEGKP